jgi:Flp pilus assembly pilin Flp
MRGIMFLEQLRGLVKSELGGTAAEYAILASLIAAVIVAVVFSIGIQVNSLFSGALGIGS